MVNIKLASIYQIKHNSGYIYIGMSTNTFGRWQSHYNLLKKGIHHSPKLQKLWSNSIPSEWSFSVLEYISFTEWKKESQLKGKAAINGFRKYLLFNEKVVMKKHSKNWCLNNDDKHFS